MKKWASFTMSLKLFVKNKKAQAELTQIEAVDFVIINRIGTKVPCFWFMFTYLNSVNGFKFWRLLEFFIQNERFIFVIRFWNFFFFYFLLGLLDTLKWDPLIITPVQRLIMDVVLITSLIFFIGSIIIYN